MATSPKTNRLFVTKGDITRRVMDTYVPDFYQDTEKFQDLARAMEIVAPIFDLLFEKSDFLPYLVDLDHIPHTLLSGLGELLGYEWDYKVSDGFQRKMLEYLTEVYSIKGTPLSYERVLRRYAQTIPMAQESVIVKISTPEVFMLDDIDSLLDGSKRLHGGEDNIIGTILLDTNVPATSQVMSNLYKFAHPAGFVLRYKRLGLFEGPIGFLVDLGTSGEVDFIVSTPQPRLVTRGDDITISDNVPRPRITYFFLVKVEAGFSTLPAESETNFFVSRHILLKLSNSSSSSSDTSNDFEVDYRVHTGIHINELADDLFDDFFTKYPDLAL
jgi:phage tail-like protein